MIIIDLTQQVATDAELTALTGISNNHIVYHTGNSSVYMYYASYRSGDLTPDVDSGVWIKESLEALDLDQYKACRFKEIDARTFELISQGFTYQSLVFSLSQNAQINISGMHQSRDDVAVTYPIAYSTLDDLNHYNVEDSADLHVMYLTALGTKKAHVDSGTVLKDAIRDAVDADAVLAVIDNR